jgi:hypothetical protein
MPAGVPVATVSIGGARNAGLLAVRILSVADDALASQLADFAVSLEALVETKNATLKANYAAELGDAASASSTEPTSSTGPTSSTEPGTPATPATPAAPATS